MQRSRFFTLATVGAIALSLSAGSLSAQASAQKAATIYWEVGPVTHGIDIQPEGSARTTVVENGAKVKVAAKWQIVNSLVASKFGASDPTLPTAHVSYWAAKYAAREFAKPALEYTDSYATASANYKRITSISTAKAKAAFAKDERIGAVKADVQRNANTAWAYVTGLVGKHGVNWVHTHKAAIAKAVAKRFKRYTTYSGSVKFKFTEDIIVQMGPTKADRERYLRYAVTVRDTTDKVAYALDMNTHEGGPYGVHKVKY